MEEDELQLHLTKGSNGAVQTGKIKIKYTTCNIVHPPLAQRQVFSGHLSYKQVLW